MQFTMLDLMIRDVMTRESSTEDFISLVGRDSVAAFWQADGLRLEFEITENGFQALPFIGAGRTLLFSLAGYEVEATVNCSEADDSGNRTCEIAFDDLSFLDEMDPRSTLALQLLQNEDANNALWEWEFNKPGVWAYYKAPYPIQGVPPDPEASTEERPVFRTLGGMRLMFKYVPEPGIDPTSYAWNIPDGTIYDGFGPDAEELSGSALDEADTVYWEPTGATGNADWDLDPSEFNASVTISYLDENGQEQEKTDAFRIVRRQLGPPDSGEDPMEGTDVAILEQVLWQLGISPQWGFPGGSGTRIDKIAQSYTSNGNVIECSEELARPRDVYSVGYEGRGPQSGISRGAICARREASIEAMVRRFRARHATPKTTLAGPNTIGSVSGVMDTQILDWLGSRYQEYLVAHSEFRLDGIISANPTRNSERARLRSWLESAATIWEEGLSASREGETSLLVPPTYTEEVHRKVLQKAGVDIDSDSEIPERYRRSELLRTWALREARTHWGAGDPQTDFRMTEGGGDEYGSMSFNQVLFQYRYSVTSACTVHQDVGLNYYHPEENIQGFVVHTAGRRNNVATACGGSFWSAFNENRLTSDYSVDNLVGYVDSDGSVKSLGSEEGKWALLKKAVGLYNGAGSILSSERSWPEILVNYTHTDQFADGNEGGRCYSCGYALDALNENFGLPYRTYIWNGGTADWDVNNDGTVSDSEKGSEWCFLYGEEEWLDPGFRVPSEGNRVARFEDYKGRARIDDDYKIGCD